MPTETSDNIITEEQQPEEMNSEYVTPEETIADEIRNYEEPMLEYEECCGNRGNYFVLIIMNHFLLRL